MLQFSLLSTPACHSLRSHGTQIDDGNWPGHSPQRSITKIIDLDHIRHRGRQPAAGKDLAVAGVRA
jgi:hypothetical protein